VGGGGSLRPAGGYAAGPAEDGCLGSLRMVGAHILRGGVGKAPHKGTVA